MAHFVSGLPEEDGGGAVAGPHVDVLRLDVPVHDVGLMDRCKRVEQRADYCIQLSLGWAASKRVEPSLQVFSFNEAEHHVGGLVLFEVSGNANDIGMPQFCECLGFGEEALKPPVVISAALAGEGGNSDAIFAVGQRSWKILLQGHIGIEPCIARQVGDAEAAGAKDADNLIVTADYRAFRQRLSVGHLSRGPRMR